MEHLHPRSESYFLRDEMSPMGLSGINSPPVVNLLAFQALTTGTLVEGCSCGWWCLRASTNNHQWLKEKEEHKSKPLKIIGEDTTRGEAADAPGFPGISTTRNS